jgi:hypothetical protein
VLEPRVARRRLLAAVAIVSALGLAIELAHAYASTPLLDAFVPALSLSYERNLPTYFSSALLLACAIAAGAIAWTRPPGRWHWWAMAIVAGYMSVDESVEIHEHLGEGIDTSGVLYFGWVIPAAAIVVALALAYIPFLRRLAPATRRRLVIAATIYVGGALFMELPLGLWTERHGMDTLGYALIDWVEETMEMIGATLALVALLAHRKENV